MPPIVIKYIKYIFSLLYYYKYLNTKDFNSIEVNRGLKAIWGFDGNSKEEIIQDSGRMSYPIEGCTDRLGNENGCLNFDGKGDYIELDKTKYRFLDTSSDLTLTCWIRL